MIANHKRIQVAIVKNGLDVAGLHARAQVLDHLVRVEHVAADLVAKADCGLGPANLIQGLGALFELNLVQAGLEPFRDGNGYRLLKATYQDALCE